MTTGARTNAPYLVVGFCFMLLGILLVLDRLGTVEAEKVIQFWPIGLVLLGGSMMVQAIRGGSDGVGPRRSDFPIGAVILLVFFGLLFSHTFERRSAAARNDDRERVNLFAVMSGDRRTSFGEHFRGGEMTSIMGGTQLDLCKAKLAPGEEAVIDVFTLMGGAIVHVPGDWTVDVQATAVMGGVKDERRRRPAQGLEEEETLDNADERRQSRPRREVNAADRERCQPRSTEDGIEIGQPRRDTEPGAGQGEGADAARSSGGDTRQPSGTGVDVERADGDVPPGSAPPRLVLRGFVMMGALVIRS